MIRRVVTLLLVALLTACATTVPSPPKESSFAVLSTLGNKLSLRQVGITVFGNTEKAIDVSQWNVDEHVEASTAIMLKSAGFKTLKSAARSTDDLGRMSYFNMTQSYTFTGGPAAMRKAALAAGADYLIVVLEAPKARSDPFFRTNQFITGYGVYQRRGGGSVTFAQIAVLLVDGKTGEVLSSCIESAGTARSDSIWIDVDAPSLDSSSLSQPREAFLRVIDGAVWKSLTFLKLSPGT